MKYPIGIQTFAKIREDGFVYVDKTELIYWLTHQSQYVFLSRPRRFGKSLLLSTIEAYFQGRKNLFDGLALADLEKEWTIHPVIHIDLNIGLYDSVENLNKHLNAQISRLEALYGSDKSEQLISDRFAGVIERASIKCEQKVVVLVDEYDKPLLEAIGDDNLQDAMRDVLRSFYGVLKSQDANIRFAMLTGVTKFGQLSVFSELNNITDITFHCKYASLCGITADELRHYFTKELNDMAMQYGCSHHEMFEKLRAMYDGYRFSEAEIRVFNPFSLLNAFFRNKLGDYWFATGTPKYLVKLLQMHHYKLKDLEGAVSTEKRLSAMDASSDDPIPVIYQSGYLTIIDYNPRRDRYELGFPNEEVRNGFFDYLWPFYAKTRDPKTFDINNFVDDIEDGYAEAFMSRLMSLTASVSYDILANCENDFQNLLYIIFTLASVKVSPEVSTSDGRIDMVVETSDYVYVMEFKIDGTAQEAIDQINDKDYPLPWKCDHRRVIRIGANFSTKQRRLTEYLIEGESK